MHPFPLLTPLPLVSYHFPRDEGGASALCWQRRPLQKLPAKVTGGRRRPSGPRPGPAQVLPRTRTSARALPRCCGCWALEREHAEASLGRAGDGGRPARECIYVQSEGGRAAGTGGERASAREAARPESRALHSTSLALTLAPQDSISLARSPVRPWRGGGPSRNVLGRYNLTPFPRDYIIGLGVVEEILCAQYYVRPPGESDSDIERPLIPSALH